MRKIVRWEWKQHTLYSDYQHHHHQQQQNYGPQWPSASSRILFHDCPSLATTHYHRIPQHPQIFHHTIINRRLGLPTLLLPSNLESTILLHILLLPTLCRSIVGDHPLSLDPPTSTNLPPQNNPPIFRSLHSPTSIEFGIHDSSVYFIIAHSLQVHRW